MAAELKQAVDNYIKHLKSGGHSDQDSKFENDIFEEAVIAVLGENAFDLVNRYIDERDEKEQ